MELKILSKSQIKAVYSNRLCHDFPSDECKPLAIILHAVDHGQYQCLGWMNGSELIGYAFLVKTGSHYLLDYLGNL